MKPVIFLPQAEQEMIEAAKYYESQTAGLGTDYLSEIERAVATIAESPSPCYLPNSVLDIIIKIQNVKRFHIINEVSFVRKSFPYFLISVVPKLHFPSY